MLLIAIIAAEVGKMVSKETKVDILVTPLVTIVVGCLLDTVDNVGVEGVDEVRHKYQNGLIYGNRPLCDRVIFQVPDCLQDFLPGGRGDLSGVVEDPGYGGDGYIGPPANFCQGGF